MKNLLFFLSFLFTAGAFAQENSQTKPQKGHYNESKFKQITDLIPTPNVYRSASGRPGKDYFQNKADYEMDIELIDDAKQPVLSSISIS